ncbi:MAG: anti-sigma factor [Pararobbsia sp.]
MKMDDSLLIAYVDGLLPPDERDKVEREIEQSPEAAACIERLYASRVRYEYAFAHQKLPAMPATLVARIEAITREYQTDAENSASPAASAHLAPPRAAAVNDAFSPPPAGAPSQAPVRSRLRFAPVWLAAAFVAGAFFCGAVLRVAPGLVPAPIAPAPMAAASAAPGAPLPWVQAAISYQQLYTRDTEAFTHPDIQGSNEIVNAIRHDDGLALRVPDLSAAGLTFKRIQRLQFHGKPLVQIVYLPAQGAPVALCVFKDAKPDEAVTPSTVDGMQVVTWRQAELGYALIGKPAGVDLAALGHLIARRSTDPLFGAAQASPAGLDG